MSVGLRMPRLEVSTVESSEITDDLWLPPLMLLLLLKNDRQQIVTKHSTEVAFKLHAQPAQVRFSAF